MNNPKVIATVNGKNKVLEILPTVIYTNAGERRYKCAVMIRDSIFTTDSRVVAISNIGYSTKENALAKVTEEKVAKWLTTRSTKNVFADLFKVTL
jgi:hypothetical protein